MDVKKMNEILADLAEDMLTTTGCACCWCEPEVPEGLKKALEEEESYKQE